MPDVAPTDGRRAKGERRRRALLEATLRVVAGGGTTGVTQRAVAAEAGVPPSAVLYYFASVDELLVAALTAVNDRHVDRLGAVAGLADLVAMVGEWAVQDRMAAVAEYELLLLAARRDDLRDELHRWDRALAEVAARLVPADRRPLLVAAVNGLCLAAVTGAPCDPDVLYRL